jgi:hypothetical protein
MSVSMYVGMVWFQTVQPRYSQAIRSTSGMPATRLQLRLFIQVHSSKPSSLRFVSRAIYFRPYSTTGKVAISGSGSVTSTETITFPGSSNVEAHSGSDDAKALQVKTIA